MEFHEISDVVAADGQTQPFRQGVDAGHTNAMQAAGNFVAVLVELAAGMQDTHDDLGGGAFRFVLVIELDADRNAPAVVGDGDGIIRVDNHLDVVAVARQGFVDGVVENLEDHVVQTGAVLGIADVHAGTFAYRLQAFQLLDAVFVVTAVLVLFHVKPLDKQLCAACAGMTPRSFRG
jgi:hypothetical protein